MSVSGGSNPFQYIWSSGQTTQDLNNIPAGNYSLIVTDNTGCKDTAFVTVTQPTDIIIQSAVVDASCGSANGAAFVTVNGGVPGYTYLWSNGGTVDSINNVVAGSYTVTVTDANGCTGSRECRYWQSEWSCCYISEHDCCNLSGRQYRATCDRCAFRNCTL